MLGAACRKAQGMQRRLHGAQCRARTPGFSSTAPAGCSPQPAAAAFIAKIELPKKEIRNFYAPMAPQLQPHLMNCSCTTTKSTCMTTSTKKACAPMGHGYVPLHVHAPHPPAPPEKMITVNAQCTVNSHSKCAVHSKCSQQMLTVND